VFDRRTSITAPTSPTLDLVVGYNAGYASSWDGATGNVTGPVFGQRRAWAATTVDPASSGIFFSSHPIDRAEASILDIAPTTLRLFGLEPPPYMEGQAVRSPEPARAIRVRRCDDGRTRHAQAAGAGWRYALVVLALARSHPAAATTSASRRAECHRARLRRHGYALTQQMLAAGRPNLARLAQSGQFGPLETTVPPQSPVAWSSFITGLDAGGTGIFDFIHRDPATMVPYLSTTRTEDGASVRLGKWRVPLRGGDVVLLRHGTAFWEILSQHGVETTIVRSPANFPPGGSARHELSGMGTPDLLGTYGTFTYFTGDETVQRVGGERGRIVASKPETVSPRRAAGPPNPFRADSRPVTS
jgi:hypothetical protein